MIIITSGPTYLDIDAYTCMVAIAELLKLQGKPALAYSSAPCNYSVCPFLITPGEITTTLPKECDRASAEYIVVDVSDPHYLGDSVPQKQITAIYDHHTGYEEYWFDRIGKNSHIEYIGSAATLIYREWKSAGLQNKLSRSTTLLLIAAILDNTLNLTSSNTTPEDIEVFQELCRKEHIDDEWCAHYFSEVQSYIEADLKNALFSDLKTIEHNHILPSKIAQLCVWDADRILVRLPEIRLWFNQTFNNWLLNIIDIQKNRSYFVCNDSRYQNEIEQLFNTSFENDIAVLPNSFLRKEIIKKSKFKMNTEDSQ